jgi:hypothetical protein
LLIPFETKIAMNLANLTKKASDAVTAGGMVDE